MVSIIVPVYNAEGDIRRSFEQKVSVIIPIYNTEQYLRRCLDSIMKQTYKNIEVIMINDGSHDGSEEIAMEFEKNDGRFHLLMQENAGVSAARNAGLDLATGELILFIDSDDWAEESMIELLVSNMQVENADVSCCQSDRETVSGIRDHECWEKEKFLEMFLIHKNFNGSLVNKLIKKSIIKDIRFDKNIKYGEDALFLWKVLLESNSLVITNQVLYHVSLHDDSASGGGSYKPIRRDCIPVWQKIEYDASCLGNKYRKLARGQLANMAFFSLYQMFYYGYRNRDDEALFAQVLKKYYDDLKVSDTITKKEKVVAKVMLYNMAVPRVLFMLRAKMRSLLKRL